MVLLAGGDIPSGFPPNAVTGNGHDLAHVHRIVRETRMTASEYYAAEGAKHRTLMETDEFRTLSTVRERTGRQRRRTQRGGRRQRHPSLEMGQRRRVNDDLAAAEWRAGRSRDGVDSPPYWHHRRRRSFPPGVRSPRTSMRPEGSGRASTFKAPGPYQSARGRALSLPRAPGLSAVLRLARRRRRGRR